MSVLSRLWRAFTGRAELLAPPSVASTGNPLYQQVATFRLFDFLAGVPDPDEVLRRTGRTRRDLRELLRDAEVAQALDTRREAVIATTWRLEPMQSRAEKFVYAELLQHMTTLLSYLWNAIPYGYSVVELVYAQRAGRIGVGSVHAPPFEWFRPLPDKTLRYFPMTGEGGIDGLPADPIKFLLATRNADDRNPYGEALLSSLYWPVTWRLQGWQLWLDFLETFGAPIVVGKTSSYDAFVDAMVKQGVRRAVGWQPTGDKDEITTITASTAGEFERLEDALNRTIQKVVLGQTLTSDVGKSGSFAAAKVHEDVRDDKRRADIRTVGTAIQRLVENLWTLNSFPGEAPQFVMQDDVGLERERADRDAILSAIGVRFTEEYLTDRYDLEQGDFTLVDPTQVQPVQPGGVNPRETVKQTQSALAVPRFTPQQEAIEQGIAGALPKAGSPITAAELRGAIAAARDERDLEERLAVLIDRQSPDFVDYLARAQFAANVLGYLHEREAA